MSQQQQKQDSPAATGGASPKDGEGMNGALFVQLMHQFYQQGWMLGSSGAMAAACPAAADNGGPAAGDTGGWLVSPSGVPKERLSEDDLFLLDFNRPEPEDFKLLQGPIRLRPSACSPIFRLLSQCHFGIGTGSLCQCQCVIHTHSKHANLVSWLLTPRDRLEIEGQEMLKGVLDRRTCIPLRNTGGDKLVLPILENAPEEQDLLPAMRKALEQFPQSPAILVRRHGLFVWGPSWQKTKVMLECIEHMLELEWEMRRAGGMAGPSRQQQH